MASDKAVSGGGMADGTLGKVQAAGSRGIFVSTNWARAKRREQMRWKSQQRTAPVGEGAERSLVAFLPDGTQLDQSCGS